MKRLIVVVPAISPWPKRWNPLRERWKSEPELAPSDWFFWNHRAGYLCGKSIMQLGRELSAKIHEHWVVAHGYDEIILIGHSLGGLLVREAYLLAVGQDGPDRKPWAGKVKRFVLLAGISRGVDPHKFWLTDLLARFFRFLGLFPWRLIQDMLVGSTYITDLRIRWIRHLSDLGDRTPIVVQLLGTRDGAVRRDDNIDLEQFPNAYYIEVPEATHLAIYRLDLALDPDARYHLFRDAVLSEDPPHKPRQAVARKSRVIFILHGIRDSNSTWVEQLRSQILDRVPDTEVIPATYGWFSPLNFFRPNLRKQPIPWFQDQYSYYFARHPTAQFHFIGHSNGTYILGHSLAKIPSMRFDRIVLAGSVLPSDYDWTRRYDAHQVLTLRNDRSNKDWPVGLLCSALRGLPFLWRDIGTGGFDGFRDGRIQEVFYYNGDHGKPIQKENLAQIVNWVMDPAPAPKQPPSPGGEVPYVFGWLSRLAPFLIYLIIIILL